MKQKIPHTLSRGFSLVEVMVALVIGMLAMVVVLQVFSLSENSKRTSTSGGDAQQSGAMALFTIERDLRQAGFGMNSVIGTLGCTINGFDQTLGRSITLLGLSFAPVVITQGAAGLPDRITVSYGSTGNVTPIATLTNNYNGSPANFQVDNNFGFNIGDVILVVEAGNPNCTLAQVNNLPGTSQLIIHNTGVNNPRYNVASGIGIAHGPGSQIMDMGPLPIINDYTVTTPSATAPSGQLNVQNSLTDAAPTPIVDSVINLQAEYGMDDGVNNGTVVHASYTANDKVVDNWSTATPANSAAWRQVIAVRLAIVARSGLREKPNRTTGLCDATSVTPTWAGSATSPLVFTNDADGTSWRCYRYKVYETTVPLRNMLW